MSVGKDTSGDRNMKLREKIHNTGTDQLRKEAQALRLAGKVRTNAYQFRAAELRRRRFG